VGYSTVTRHFREAKSPLSTEEASDANDRKPIRDADEAILSALNESPFASVQQLSRLIHPPPTTVYHPLIQSLGIPAPHLRWVPHALADAQKVQRVNLSRQLLRVLEVQHDRAWRDIVTLDELRFCLTKDDAFISLPQGDKSKCTMNPIKCGSPAPKAEEF
jgi:hypothetical protein